jgi:hypothetical protein
MKPCLEDRNKPSLTELRHDWSLLPASTPVAPVAGLGRACKRRLSS